MDKIKSIILIKSKRIKKKLIYKICRTDQDVNKYTAHFLLLLCEWAFNV